MGTGTVFDVNDPGFPSRAIALADLTVISEPGSALSLGLGFIALALHRRQERMRSARA